MEKQEGLTMDFRFKKTKEELRRLLDLRKSSASSPAKNKKRYSRKTKHAGKDTNWD